MGLGRGYIVGTVVLHLSKDLKCLIGRSTYYDHAKGQSRYYATPL